MKKITIFKLILNLTDMPVVAIQIVHSPALVPTIPYSRTEQFHCAPAEGEFQEKFVQILKLIFPFCSHFYNLFEALEWSQGVEEGTLKKSGFFPAQLDGVFHLWKNYFKNNFIYLYFLINKPEI